MMPLLDRWEADLWEALGISDAFTRGELLALLVKAQARDRLGRFAGGGSTGGGVRDALSGHASAGEVGAAAAAEAKRITGRDIPFDFAGSDPQTAAEHAEGVLQGLERFPKANLQSVGMGTLGPTVYAHATHDGNIVFNSTFASSAGRSVYLDSLSEGAAGWDKGLRVYGINDLKMSSYHVRNSASPTAVGLHEFGHVLGIATTRRRGDPAVDALVVKAAAQQKRNQTLPGAKVKSAGDMILRSVSGYAMQNRDELIAESFTDVMLNGAGASPLSTGIFRILETEYGS